MTEKLNLKGLTYPFQRFNLAGGQCPDGYITLPSPAKWNANTQRYEPCEMTEISEAMKSQ